MGTIVGIDLGTTNSVVSYMKLGKPIIAENKGEKILRKNYYHCYYV